MKKRAIVGGMVVSSLLTSLAFAQTLFPDMLGCYGGLCLQSSLKGTSGGACSLRLDFSVACNSQYVVAGLQ